MGKDEIDLSNNEEGKKELTEVQEDKMDHNKGDKVVSKSKNSNEVVKDTKINKDGLEESKGIGNIPMIPECNLDFEVEIYIIIVN